MHHGMLGDTALYIKEECKSYNKKGKVCSKRYTNEIVTFDEYAERTVGNYMLECMKERMYVTYEYTVKTKIMKLKHNLKLFLVRQKK